MTPDQQNTLATVRSLVTRMKSGGQPLNQIRAGLIRDGWPIAAVDMAVSEARA